LRIEDRGWANVQRASTELAEVYLVLVFKDDVSGPGAGDDFGHYAMVVENPANRIHPADVRRRGAFEPADRRPAAVSPSEAVRHFQIIAKPFLQRTQFLQLVP
jgi:hypothetical protein